MRLILLTSAAAIALSSGACKSAESKGTAEQSKSQPAPANHKETSVRPQTATPKTSPRFSLDSSKYSPAPLRTERTFHLNTSPSAVWALISDHEKMPSYFPAVTKVTVDNSKANTSNGVGAVRSCAVGGMKLVEDIRIWQPNQALGYSVRAGNAMGMSDHLAVLLLEASNGGTTVRWKQYFNHPKADKMVGQINQFLTMAIKGLISKFGGKEG